MNGSESPQVGQVLSRSWDLFQRNWQSYIQLGLIDWAFFLVVVLLGFVVQPLGIIVNLVLLGAIQVGILSVLMAHLEGQPFDLGRLRHGFDIYAVALLAGVIVYVVQMIGFVLLCVGLIPAVAAMFLVFPLVVKGRQPIDAVQESFAYFMAHPWPLLLLSLILIVGQAVALLLCSVGLIVYGPIAALVSIVLCEDYLARTAAPETAPAGAGEDDPE